MRPRRSPTLILFAAGCLVVLVAVGYSVSLVVENYDRVPFFDMVEVEGWLSNHVLAHGLDLRAAATMRSNEHRPVFPMVFWIIDHAWLRSSGLLPVIVNLACMAGASAIFGWLAVRAAGPRRAALLVLAAPVVLFWPAHAENLLWPMQIHTLMATAAGLSGLTLLAGADARRAVGARFMLPQAAAAFACLFIALFSFGYGLTAWTIAGPFLLYRRWPLALLVPLMLLWAAGLGLYGLTFDFASKLDVPRWTTAPLALVEYILLFLGAPFRCILEAMGRRGEVTSLMAFGGVGFLGAVIALVEMLIPRAADDRTPVAMARRAAGLIILWALMTAIVTALARVKYGIFQSLSLRYLIMPVVFWLALSIVALGWLPGRRRAAMLAEFALGAATIVVLASYPFYGRAMADHAFYVRVAAIGALLRVPAGDSGYRIHPDDRALWTVLDDQQQRGVGIFRDDWPHWPGRQLDDLFRIAPETRCAGAIDRAERAGPGVVAATGWAFDRKAQAVPPWLIIVDRDRRIVGLASAGVRRPDVAAALGTGQAAAAGWHGLVRLAPAEPGTLYAVLADGVVCRLPGDLAG